MLFRYQTPRGGAWQNALLVEAGELSIELNVEVTVVHSDCRDLVDTKIKEASKHEHNAIGIAGAS